MTTVSAPAPLAGFTMGVTAAGGADELGVMLERRGAPIQHASALARERQILDDLLRALRGPELAHRRAFDAAAGPAPAGGHRLHGVAR